MDNSALGGRQHGTNGAMQLGAAGEETACGILRRHGYNILARNWRCGRLELDIICEHDAQIVFVEVKTRRKNARGGGAFAVNESKKRRLLRAAAAWLSISGLWGRPCRFDVICLTGTAENFRMEHYRNAFELSEAMGCGNPYWQPW